jgi:putative ABC transport system ATP-binding protein
MIVADRVTKSLRAGEVVSPVLRGVTLSIDRGTFVAVVGPSGCGKTTFLAMLAALDRPDGGSLRVGSLDLATAPEPERERYRRETIGLVLQFWNLLPTLTALENVEAGLELLPLDAATRRKRARDFLDRVGLSAAVGKYPAQLSGGMQQRVAVARALAREPSLLLADEPTGSLDRENGAQVFELMVSLQKSLGVTCLMVTHDPHLASRADRVIVFEDGRVKDEPNEKVSSSPSSPR